MQFFTVPRDKPLRLAFSPDGRYLAGGGGQAFHLWDLAVGPNPLWTLKRSDLALNFTFAPGRSDLFGGSYGEFARYDLRTGRVDLDAALGRLFGPQWISPCGRFGLAADPDRDLQVLNLRCARLEPDRCTELWRKDITYNPDYGWYGYRSLLFSSDGSRLVRVAGCGPRNKHNVTATSVEVFDVITGEIVATWAGELPLYATQGAVSPSGVVALINGRALHVIDAIARGNVSTKHVNPSPKPLEMVAFARDGSRLAAVGRDTVATVWDATTWEVRKRYEWQIGQLRSVCFATDGLRCAAGGDKQIVVWDLDE
jgi:WD40 repeat protein